MKRQQLVSPGSINRMLQAAAESWRRRQFQQSFDVLHKANRLDPANTNILLELGRYHGLRYEYALAEECFEKAIRITAQKAELLAAIGLKSYDFKDTRLAEKYLRLAVEQPGVSPDSLVVLADFYERRRQVDDAAALVARALHLNKTCGPALLTQARLDRLAGRLQQAESCIRILLSQPEPGAQPGPERDTRIRAWYELAAILDRQKRYDEAMDSFLKAKSMLRLHAARQSAELKVVRNRLRELRETLTVQMLQRWQAVGAEFGSAHRMAFLCGHPRSGTTLLEQVLDSHPDIVSAEETTIFNDEVYVPMEQSFSKDQAILPALESATATVLQQSRERYFSAMELSLSKPIAQRLLIDKNPSLTFLISALVRVFPETKLLIALRDPRDVVLSCFMQAFVPVMQVSSAFLSLEDTANEYVELMQMWRTLAPMLQNPSLEVRYEDMVEDLPSTARRVLDFLEVSWDERVLHFDEHARQKMVRSPTYADVTRPVFKTAMGRWRSYQKYLEPYLDRLEPFVKAFGYD